jgi:hypothetical protein
MNRRSMFSRLFGGLLLGTQSTSLDVKPMKLTQGQFVRLESTPAFDEAKIASLVIDNLTKCGIDFKTGKFLNLALTTDREADTIWDTVDTSTSG